MKKIFIVFFCIYTLMVLHSCTELKSPHYVGVIQEPMELAENLERESIWVFNEEVYYIRITDSTNIIFSRVNWNQSKNDYVVNSLPMLITRLGNNYFMNIKNESDSLYSIYRISGIIPEEGSIAFLSMNKDSLDNLITTTGISVTKSESSYTLDMPKDDLDRFMQNHVNRIFPFANVGIIKNIAGFKKKPAKSH
jgi:hypothetical protein